jgi:hypothetical protein
VAFDVELAHLDRRSKVGDPAIKRKQLFSAPVPISFCFNQPLRGAGHLARAPATAKHVNAHFKQAVARARGEACARRRGHANAHGIDEKHRACCAAGAHAARW